MFRSESVFEYACVCVIVCVHNERVRVCVVVEHDNVRGGCVGDDGGGCSGASGNVIQNRHLPSMPTMTSSSSSMGTLPPRHGGAPFHVSNKNITISSIVHGCMCVSACAWRRECMWA